MRQHRTRSSTVLRLFLSIFFLAIGVLGMWRLSPQPTADAPAALQQPAAANLPTKPTTTSPTMSLNPAEPLKIRIPAINLTASIQGVGRTTNGEMDAPTHAADVAWYRGGYLPGSLGNTVLAAHYMHTSGPGAFYHLSRLSPGDLITVQTKENIQYYTVTKLKTYANNDLSALQEVFGASNTANLNLITCSGDWDEASDRYATRLVTFGQFIREE